MIKKLISGGQTGADIAELDVALGHGFPHGGWCPAGRKSLDGPLPARYQLTETPSDNYIQRTEWNVRDNDGTVVFTMAREATGGLSETTRLVVEEVITRLIEFYIRGWNFSADDDAQIRKELGALKESHEEP